ncbi:hypothetical protein GCM10009648_37220 [Tsukamurella spumae]
MPASATQNSRIHAAYRTQSRPIRAKTVVLAAELSWVSITVASAPPGGSRPWSKNRTELIGVNGIPIAGVRLASPGVGSDAQQ